MRQRGFTLAEMLVTITIVAILAAIAVPNFDVLVAGRQVRAAAEQLRDVLVLARQESLKRNAPVVVTANNSIITATISAFGASPAVQLATFTSKSTVSANSVTFDGGGRASAATTFGISPVALNCKSGGGPVPCYNVEVLTGGAVRLCDPTKSVGDMQACL